MSSVTFISNMKIDCFEKTEKLILSEEITRIRRILPVTCLLQEFHLQLFYVFWLLCVAQCWIYQSSLSLCSCYIQRVEHQWQWCSSVFCIELPFKKLVVGFHTDFQMTSSVDYPSFTILFHLLPLPRTLYSISLSLWDLPYS